MVFRVHNLDFAQAYSICELKHLPSGKSNLRHYYYPGGLTSGGRGGPILQVFPDIGDAWIGTFASGYFSPAALTGYFGCPDGISILVVSGGRGIMVKADSPDEWSEVNRFPIVAVQPIPLENLLLVADFSKISAINTQGIFWTTEHLSWDGIRLGEVDSGRVYGLAWDSPINQWVPFEVLLKDGSTIGGASPPNEAPTE